MPIYFDLSLDLYQLRADSPRCEPVLLLLFCDPERPAPGSRCQPHLSPTQLSPVERPALALLGHREVALARTRSPVNETCGFVGPQLRRYATSSAPHRRPTYSALKSCEIVPRLYSTSRHSRNTGTRRSENSLSQYWFLERRMRLSQFIVL
jgi:hypothetical protein